MADTVSTYSAMLRTYYLEEKVMNLVYDKNPFLTMVEKNEGFVGDSYKVPVIFTGNNAALNSFTNAQAMAVSASQGTAAFTVTSRSTLYGFTNWSRESMLATASDVGAFMPVAKVAVDNILRQMGNRLATMCWRSGYGDQGNIGDVATTQITLAQVDDVVNFEKGQRLDLAATQTGAIKAYGTSTNPLIITGVDRSNGILTFGFNVTDATNGIPTAAVGDFISLQGEAPNAGTAKLLFGVESWIPAATPATSDSFWSVNRSQDTRLSGQRLNATDGRPLEEALIEAAQIVAREGGQLSHFFLGYSAYARLLKQMQGRVQLVDVETDAGIGFRGATVQTPSGEVLIVPDRTCPANRIFGLELSSWELASLGKLVAPVEEDDVMILRSASADTFESRYATYAQLVCKAPGHNINVQISTS